VNVSYHDIKKWVLFNSVMDLESTEASRVRRSQTTELFCHGISLCPEKYSTDVKTYSDAADDS
jgi:hypothetical protein